VVAINKTKNAKMNNETNSQQPSRKTYIVQFTLPAVGIAHPYDDPNKEIESVEKYLEDHTEFLRNTQKPWFTVMIKRFFDWIRENDLSGTMNKQCFLSPHHGTLIIQCEPATAEMMNSYPGAQAREMSELSACFEFEA
jgi:hypothetical protein